MQRYQRKDHSTSGKAIRQYIQRFLSGFQRFQRQHKGDVMPAQWRNVSVFQRFSAVSAVSTESPLYDGESHTAIHPTVYQRFQRLQRQHNWRRRTDPKEKRQRFPAVSAVSAERTLYDWESDTAIHPAVYQRFPAGSVVTPLYKWASY